MGYKNNDKCLDKVDDDEPIFVLRAQDKLSLDTVHNWYQKAKPTLTEEHQKEVRTIIDDFAHWQQMHQDRVKFPD
jgi:thymidine phosphorylase